jgi:hypothetical protein
LIQTTNGAIAMIQVVHILCLSTLFSCALLLALRFMGRGLVSDTLQQLAARLAPLIWKLLLVLLITGLLLITAEPERTITNLAFYVKVVMLTLVSLLTLWLAASARRGLTSPSPLHMAAAACMILLWGGIIVAGRLIAYTQSY